MIQRDAGDLEKALQTLNENTGLIHDKELFMREKGEKKFFLSCWIYK